MNQRIPMNLHCAPCLVTFTVAHYPMSIEEFAKAATALCPACGAGSDTLVFADGPVTFTPLPKEATS